MEKNRETIFECCNEGEGELPFEIGYQDHLTLREKELPEPPRVREIGAIDLSIHLYPGDETIYPIHKPSLQKVHDSPLSKII
jgi:hypothetical protein